MAETNETTASRPGPEGLTRAAWRKPVTDAQRDARERDLRQSCRFSPYWAPGRGLNGKRGGRGPHGSGRWSKLKVKLLEQHSALRPRSRQKRRGR